MTEFARRDFLKALGVGGAAALGATLLNPRTGRVRAQASSTIGTVVRIASGPVTLHSYVAPAASFEVTTHIIETENSLVLVDMQLVGSFARDVRAYAESLGKPIERIFLSHEHPDHYAGSENFSDLPLFATEATIANVQAAVDGGSLDDLAGLIGDEAPSSVYLPTETVAAGDETIDGVLFEYQVYNDHESAEALVIRIPDAGALIVQDLVYSAAHFFPGNDRDNWIATLETLRGQENRFLLAGHGLPTTVGTLDTAIDYLSFVQETLPTVDDAPALIAALQTEYPSYGVVGILDFWNQFFPAS